MSSTSKMWITKWIFFVLPILCALVKETVTSQRYQENMLDDHTFTPGFLTLGQKYSIAIGNTVVLPCKINETEPMFVLCWKRDIAVLTAGPVQVTMNSRIRLMPAEDGLSNSGYNLEIRDVRTSDAGQYACQLGTTPPKEIVHTLEVMEPPKIIYIQPNTRLEVAKGSSIKMECRASGNPKPRTIWSRKNNVMPNGEANFTGNILEMMHVNRHTTGHYRCTADNRVGQPDSREIFVNVLYSPEIEVERTFIHTGVGYEAILICIVHAEPQPNIIWYKDTTQLGTTEQHSQQVRGNKYSLIIRNVTYMDLGNYTCQASNNLGKDRGSLTLSGIPTVCYFDSPTLSHYRDQYNISWTVQSYSPIREYRLFYKRQQQPHQQRMGGSGGSSSVHGGGITNIGRSMYPDGKPHSSIDNQLMSPHIYAPYGISQTVSADQWENVVIPEVYHDYAHKGGSYRGHNGPNMIASHHIVSQNFRHRMHFLIKNLAPSSNYEARVQARNDHGWNKLSTTFHFSTRSEDIDAEPSAQPAVLHGAELKEKDFWSGSASLTPAVYLGNLLVIILIITFQLST